MFALLREADGSRSIVSAVTFRFCDDRDWTDQADYMANIRETAAIHNLSNVVHNRKNGVEGVYRRDQADIDPRNGRGMNTMIASHTKWTEAYYAMCAGEYCTT